MPRPKNKSKSPARFNKTSKAIFERRPRLSPKKPEFVTKKPVAIAQKSNESNELSERKISLLTKVEHLKLQIRHTKKREKLKTQKVSKLLFFLHTLQMDYGIEINKMYEEAGLL